MEKSKPKKMDAKRFKEWIEDNGAVCRASRSRLECVIDISHIEPGHFAAFYAVPSPSGLMIVELAEYIPSEEAAWQALQNDESPTHAGRPCNEWMKEQYLTDKNARVEKLEI